MAGESGAGEPRAGGQGPLVLRAGDIVLANWRGDALPKEPNKRRPAAVVEDDGLFAPSYPNAILVPLAEDAALAIPDLSVAIAPSVENGCGKPCRAVSHLVATIAKARLRATGSRITAEQLAAIRRQIALAVGGRGREIESAPPLDSRPKKSRSPVGPDESGR